MKRDSDRLAALLGAEPHRLGFFRLVALVGERLNAGDLLEEPLSHDSSAGLRGSVVSDSDSAGMRESLIPAFPRHDRIRFRHAPELTFHAGDVSSARLVREGGVERVELTCNFLGLTGASSPLPLHLADALSRLETDIDSDDAAALSAFLDLFHHRLLSLLYRAHARAVPTRTYRLGGADDWSERLLSVSGVWPVPAAKRWPDPKSSEVSGLHRHDLLHLMPLLFRRARPVWALREALGAALTRRLGPVRVDVEEFAGGFCALPEEDRSYLGRSCSRLGTSTVLGTSVRDLASKIRLALGPVTREQYRALLATSGILSLIRELVTLFDTTPTEVEVEVLLQPEAVPQLRLGDEASAVLGKTTFLPEAKGVARVRLGQV